ncbi:MAG: TIGR04084 family radical SAM/SPASM domain-containing protein [Methanomicrobium sp.]|nr:TIGR04084 family radical SAM/SPASM domain-containing protein [Methanomicrobium sp.]
MNYFILLTDECNLCCTYCRGKMFFMSDESPDKVTIDNTLPCDFDLSLKNLYSFLSKDKDAVLTFYGGEPLMRSDLIREIMDNAPVKDFAIQTNATLLYLLESDYVNKFKSIFASIDGDRKTTDNCRGFGTYDKVIKNLKKIINNGYGNEIIARMTVTEKTDIYESVRYLSDNPDFSFDSIHWQMDSNFWGDFKLRENFCGWVKNSYNPGIRRLVDLWTDTMKKEGRVMRWYPFVGTMQDVLLKNGSSPLRCGCGVNSYSILQDGNLAPCPCMAGMRDYYCGHINSDTPQSLKKIEIAGDCINCDILNFCGGRCLYSNLTQPWPPEGRRAVYETVRNLKFAIEKNSVFVKEMIDEGIVSLNQFEHQKYNGCEIIP